jgi:hypothetical protein
MEDLEKAINDGDYKTAFKIASLGKNSFLSPKQRLPRAINLARSKGMIRVARELEYILSEIEQEEKRNR